MRLENPHEHADIIEKFTDTKFRGYHLLLPWSNSEPTSTTPVRYFRHSRDEESSEVESTSRNNIESLTAQKKSIEQAIELERSKTDTQKQEEALEQYKQDNERRRSMIVTLQSIEIQRQKNQIEEDRKKITEEKQRCDEQRRENEVENRRIRAMEAEVHKREIKLVLDRANLHAREVDLERREKEAKRQEKGKRRRDEEDET